MSQITLVAYRDPKNATVMKIDEENTSVQKITLRFRPWSLCFKLEVFRKTATGHKFFDRTFLVEQTEFVVTLEKSGNTFNIYGEHASLSIPRILLNSQCRPLIAQIETDSLTSTELYYRNQAWERIYANYEKFYF